ncbi:hypothetical protein M501DRAFT_997417 [Patellaria atrata CBS 101060]|uniref:Uncharacterized protein n=1 Tax=Patellaria atrata CBS 101060 TaxID=1346257 RepID=A0A9P4S6W9_9PEZI|nr:hypothetical protein M501DRAFT_997417 [Patellaria atrata CBS 101060]
MAKHLTDQMRSEEMRAWDGSGMRCSPSIIFCWIVSVFISAMTQRKYAKDRDWRLRLELRAPVLHRSWK